MLTVLATFSFVVVAAVASATYTVLLLALVVVQFEETVLSRLVHVPVPSAIQTTTMKTENYRALQLRQQRYHHLRRRHRGLYLHSCRYNFYWTHQ